MAIIPDKRLKIEKAIENKIINQQFRQHLGASEIGKACSREIWYSFRWTTKRSINPRLNRLFNRGHMEELVVIEDLINAGCRIEGINIDDSIHKRFYTLFKHELPKAKQNNKKFAFGHGGSSCDGIIFNLPDALKTPHLFECKTANEKSFNSMIKKGVKDSKFVHYIQMQIYMHLFKLKRALYIMVHKDTDARHYERIKYDPKIAKEYIKRAEIIITSEQPPAKISNDPSYYLCGWCDHSKVCHFQKEPIKNCRTCNSLGIRDNGVMKCESTKKKLPFKKQVKGCKKYQMNKNYH